MTLGRGIEVTSPTYGVILVNGSVTFGATGAVSSTDAPYGEFSVAKAATGRYTFTFGEKYNKFLNVVTISDTQGTVVDGQYDIFTGYSSSAGTITLSHVVAGIEADPASGTVHHFTFIMKLSDI